MSLAYPDSSWPDAPDRPGHHAMPEDNTEPWRSDNPNSYYNENMLPVIKSPLLDLAPGEEDYTSPVVAP